MKKLLVLFSFLIANSSWALYGNNVRVSHDQFVVSLINSGAYFCSGVLISKTTVVTAAHCIEMQGQEIYDSSEALIYQPEQLLVRVAHKIVKAKKVSISPTYTEGLGFDNEDLALIELVSPINHVYPIVIAKPSEITPKSNLTLIARQKKVSAKLGQFKHYKSSDVLFLNKNSGACLGDSGGAVTIMNSGQQKLAGILMYDGEGQCEKKVNYSYFPKSRF